MKVDIPKVTDAEVAFGTTKYLPKMDDIPKEFKDETNKWNTLFDNMFYGHKNNNIEVVPKAGVNAINAMRLIKAHMSSMEPQHEHKRAGVSFMFSQYFDDWTHGKS